METGRELDALVAEKVMGWTWVESDGYWRTGGQHKPAGWSPSTDIAAAWEVVSKMRELGLYLELRGWVQVSDFIVGFILPGGREYVVTDDTAPLAICRAALRAVGYDDA